MAPKSKDQTQRSGIQKKLIASGVLVLIFALLYTLVITENQLLILGIVLVGAVCLLVYSRIARINVIVSQSFASERKTLLIVLSLLALLAPLPLRGEPYVLHIFIITFIYAILSMGLNIQVGSAGIPNLGFAAFYGVGAYASSLLAIHLGLSFWASIILGALIAGLFGFLVGLPTLKTRTYHLALVSIAFGLVTYIMLNNLAFTGGPNGVNNIPTPTLFGWSLLNSLQLFGIKFPMQLNFYYLSLFFLVIMVIAAYFLYNSRVGLTWNAIREDEIAAKCSGVNTAREKLLSFSTGAFFAGIAGSLYAHYIGYISPENFNMGISLLILGMVIMGGMDNIVGASAGAFVLVVAPEKFRALANFRMVAAGMIIILMLMFRPQGIVPQQIREYSAIFKKRLGMKVTKHD